MQAAVQKNDDTTKKYAAIWNIQTHTYAHTDTQIFYARIQSIKRNSFCVNLEVDSATQPSEGIIQIAEGRVLFR